jgi:5-methylcytosine-specific restriction endonuclease McrA
MDCAACNRIHCIYNLVWACKNCNSSKGVKGLCEFFQLKYPDDKKFYDRIPPLAEKNI